MENLKLRIHQTACIASAASENAPTKMFYGQYRKAAVVQDIKGCKIDLQYLRKRGETQVLYLNEENHSSKSLMLDIFQVLKELTVCR